MNRFTSIALVGVGMLSLGTTAIAQPAASPAPRGGESRQPMDRAALQARAAAMFDAADKNRDGLLSVEERQAQRAEGREKMRERMFARLDANNDGTISKEEFNARRNATRPARPEGARDEKRERSAAFRSHGRGFGGMMMPHQLAEYRDKPIPRATFIEASLVRFDRMDTDRDGKISAAERDAARKAMMERRTQQRPATSKPTS